MIRVASVVAVIAFSAIIAWLLIAKPQLSTPDAAPIVAFGLTSQPAALEVRRDASVSEESGSQTAELMLTNNGAESVRITAIDPTCGCTVTEPLQTDTLGPGESTPLRLKVDVQQYGTRAVQISVYTEPQAAGLVIPLSLVGEELKPPFIQSLTGQMDIVGFEPGGESSREATLNTVESVGSSPWVKGIVCSDPAVRAELLNDPDDQQFDDHIVFRTYTFRVTARLPDTNAHTKPAEMTFDTAGPPTAPFPRMSVRVRCQPALSAAPDLIFVSTEDLADEVVTRDVLVRAADKTDWTVKSVSTNRPFLHAEVQEQSAQGSPARIRIEIRPAESDAGTVADDEPTLTVLTSHPLMPSLDVPVLLQTLLAGDP